MRCVSTILATFKLKEISKMKTGNVDKFIQLLEDHELLKITPAALTLNEIVTLAELTGEKLSTDDLAQAIDKLKQTPDEQLSRVEQNWKCS
jgi:23S rRNA pseudoU1915 N3-methylase RlmH